MANYKVGTDTKSVNSHLRLALKRAAASGVIKHAKGTGASGSFRVTEKAEKPKKVSVFSWYKPVYRSYKHFAMLFLA